MKHTHFVNPTGSPVDDHCTSVRELSLLHDYPHIVTVSSLKSYTYSRITQLNRNLLVFRDPNVDGM